jgi:hypothetical protein
MNHFFRFFVAVLLAAAFAAPAPAQTYLGLTLEGGIPYDDFEDALDDVAVGASAQLLVQAGALPVALGLDAGLLTYGQQARPLAAQIDGSSAFLGDVETTNNVAHVHAVLRLMPGSGAVRPFADGLVGFNYLYTRTRFEQEVYLVDGDSFFDPGTDAVVGRTVTNSTVLDDFALSYGAGAGLLIRVAKGKDDGMPFEAFFEVGARYLFGEEARYLLEAAPLGEDEMPRVLVRESKTDMIRPQLGLVIQFGS